MTNGQTHIDGWVKNMTNGRMHRGKKGDIIIHHTYGKLFSKVGYTDTPVKASHELGGFRDFM